MSRTLLFIDHDNRLHLPPAPDHLVITTPPDKQISIEQVRKLIQWAHLKPFIQKQKIGFIRAAQNLSLPAQNALLKILEEPPIKTLIVLSVNNPQRLLLTVQSRCLPTAFEDLSKFGFEQKMPPDQSSKELFLGMPATKLQRLKLAEKMAKMSQAEIINELNLLLIQLESELCSYLKETSYQVKDNKIKKLLDQMEKVFYTQKVLRANANKRLALENLFLALN